MVAPATPELLALQDLCARLDGAGIPYMLTGSLAMSYYARPRMTRDIDLVLALDAGGVFTLMRAPAVQYHPSPYRGEDRSHSQKGRRLSARSELQLGDVRHLLETPRDEAYLGRWAARLGLEDLLKEARGA